MLIYFFTNQPKVCEKIADKLESAGYQTIVLENQKMFFHLLNSNDEKPSLFVMDYSMFQHDVLNIYRYMKEKKRIVPLIFYNDPYPDETVRARFWMYQCRTHFKDLDISPLKDAFYIIAQAVDSKELKPYIPLIQKPLPFHDKEIDNKMQSPPQKTDGINIYELRKKMKMPPSVFHLFEFLYERMGIFVSIDELQHTVLLNGKTACPGSVTSYISRLRACLNRCKNCRMDILYSNKCYKLICY
ncbi:helix-turn-helix domain-containing protein [Treponema parvum]|uniref:helix-turn-helix domain-containing protein n=1 Tax=Treponema parvum TaxID=138851 RepID=UPI001AEBE184|nr:helix-turn-helix domain-containing protein [Treponema parvum]QTQ16642.1 helix-turn-helix domain-containing protein [Treponema parvum]